MNVGILPELKLTVQVVIASLSRHDATRAQCGRHSIVCWEHVQPVVCCMYQFHNHYSRHLFKRHHVVGCPCPFFQCADVALYFRYVFVLGSHIELRPSDCQISPKGHKFSIPMAFSDPKTSLFVECNHGGKAFSDNIRLPGRESFGAPKPEGSRHCDQEGDLVDEHDVKAQSDILVGLNDVVRNVRHKTPDVVVFMACCFSHQ